ncbi:MAG: lactate dehydrogenase-like oxidoreductase [Planctomycetota bacterium]|nr:lactate dehydrogenase-like oxidoreductase [Planctomycetota bacterium]
MSQRPIILSLTNMAESGLVMLSDAGELRMASSLKPEVLYREIADADALVIRTAGTIDGALMDAAPRLRVIGRHGVGYDQVDVPAATVRGIQVVYTPGANTEAVAAHTIAFMIGLSKHFPQQMASLLAGRYNDRTKYVGRDLTGRTLGIIGFGRIGKRVGEIARVAFGMNVLYTDIVAPPPEAEKKAGARRVELDELLMASEYVTLHVPLDESTRRLIDRAALSRMRPDAALINTCRGPVVDEQAVAEALDVHRLWGYAADVYDVEPPPADHPLIGRPDVMLTPHSAAQTVESLRNMAEGIAEDVVGVLNGKAPRNPVNDPAEVAAIRRRLGK